MLKYDCLLFLSVFLCSNARAQPDELLLRLTGAPLRLLLHKDSIQGLEEVAHSPIVPETDTVFLQKEPENTLDDFYAKHIRQYRLKDQCYQYISLYFCNNRLIQVNIYATDPIRQRQIFSETEDIEAKKRYGIGISSDSVKWVGDSIIRYGRYYTYRTNGWRGNFGFHYRAYDKENLTTLVLYHRGVMKEMPSWCGNCNGDNTWEKLYRYMERNAPERKSRGSERNKTKVR